MKSLVKQLLPTFFSATSRRWPQRGIDRCRGELNVADLLEREVVPLSSMEARSLLKGQVILVTGAAGSIGSELCRQLLEYEPARLIALDINETGLFDLAESLREHPLFAVLELCIADIRETWSMARHLKRFRPQTIFHAAAYKHVPLLEEHPDQAIHTNVLATYRLCLLAQEHSVGHFVFVSSDKAAEPVSVLGASKLAGEMIVQALGGVNEGGSATCFCAVRFGNVIGSRGSVVPLFASQIARGGPLTVTDPRASRYFMTIPEACGLVILSTAIATPGGLYLLDMGEPVRILDLAIKLIRLHGLREDRDISIVYTGLRPGERLHEILAAPGEKLVSTVHSRILSIRSASALCMPAMVGAWMASLEEGLKQGCNERLRERLFAIVREREVAVEGEMLSMSMSAMVEQAAG